jgi:hypothetical protein
MSNNILDDFIDFSNININDFIGKYLIEKFILNEEELTYYPFQLFTNHYIFDEELKSNLITLINLIKNNINDYSENELLDYTKSLIINSICSNNPNCLCPIIYKYKISLNYKFYNQYNIIKKIIIAGKSQEELNKSIEIRLQIQEDFNNSINIRLNSINNINNYQKIFIFIFISILSFIYIHLNIK